MPCHDPGPSPQEIEFERRIRRGAVVGLCRACALLDANGLLPEELQAWYAVHRASDDNRDWYDAAKRDLDLVRASSRAQGFDLAYDHPAQKRVNDCYSKLRQSEMLEQQEQAKLADLGD